MHLLMSHHSEFKKGANTKWEEKRKSEEEGGRKKLLPLSALSWPDYPSQPKGFEKKSYDNDNQNRKLNETILLYYIL